MDWKEVTAELFTQAGLKLLDKGIHVVIRGKNYFEVLNVRFDSDLIGLTSCPEITSISQWWRQRNKFLDFIPLEQANYLDISSGLSSVFAVQTNDISPNSRRYIQVTPNSMLPGNQRADFPSCVPIVQIQFRNHTAYLTAYFRSLDVNLMRLDCAWLLWIAKTYAQYAQYQFQEPFKWVKLTLMVANLHRSEKPDGGIEND